MSNDELNSGKCLSAIFQICCNPQSGKSKGKALKMISDYAVLGQKKLAAEQVYNSAELAAMAQVAQEAVSLVTQHCPDDVVKDFDENFTKKLKSGELQSALIKQMQDDHKKKKEEGPKIEIAR